MNKTFAFVTLIAVLLVGYFLLRGDKAIAPAELPIENDEAGAETDTNASMVSIDPISHASFVLTLGDVLLFNDPVGDASAFAAFGEPDIILVSDIHGDHLNLETLEAVTGELTTIVAPQAVADEFTEALLAQTMVLQNGDELLVANVNIEATPMYNLPEQGVEIRHEEGRGNGYLLTYAGERIYIAGDTADTPHMRALEDIDIAFVPMNLPYTMSVEAAADAVIEFAPATVYPYHYRTPEGLADVVEFQRLVSVGNPDIKVKLLNWYPET